MFLSSVFYGNAKKYIHVMINLGSASICLNVLLSDCELHIPGVTKIIHNLVAPFGALMSQIRYKSNSTPETVCCCFPVCPFFPLFSRWVLCMILQTFFLEQLCFKFILHCFSRVFMAVPYAIYRGLCFCTTKGHISFTMLLSDKNYRNFELAAH